MVATTADIKVTARWDGKDLDRGTKQAARDLDRVDKAAKNAGRAFQALGAAFGVAIGIETVRQIGMAAYQMDQFASATNAARKGFMSMAQKSGANPTQLLKEIDDAAAGTLSRFQMMVTANIALSSGIKNLSGNMGSLIKNIRTVSTGLGRVASVDIERVISAINKQEQELLDELGIVARVETAYKNYAVSLNRTVKSLSDLEKREAFAILVKEQLAIKAAAMGEVVNEAADAAGRLAANWRNLQDTIGNTFAFEGAISALADLAGGLEDIIATLSRSDFSFTWLDALGAVMPGGGGIGGTLVRAADSYNREKREVVDMTAVDESMAAPFFTGPKQFPGSGVLKNPDRNFLPGDAEILARHEVAEQAAKDILAEEKLLGVLRVEAIRAINEDVLEAQDADEIGRQILEAQKDLGDDLLKQQQADNRKRYFDMKRHSDDEAAELKKRADDEAAELKKRADADRAAWDSFRDFTQGIRESKDAIQDVLSVIARFNPEMANFGNEIVSAVEKISAARMTGASAATKASAALAAMNVAITAFEFLDKIIPRATHATQNYVSALRAVEDQTLSTTEALTRAADALMGFSEERLKAIVAAEADFTKMISAVENPSVGSSFSAQAGVLLEREFAEFKPHDVLGLSGTSTLGGISVESAIAAILKANEEGADTSAEMHKAINIFLDRFAVMSSTSLDDVTSMFATLTGDVVDRLGVPLLSEGALNLGPLQELVDLINASMLSGQAQSIGGASDTFRLNLREEEIRTGQDISPARREALLMKSFENIVASWDFEGLTFTLEEGVNISLQQRNILRDLLLENAEFHQDFLSTMEDPARRAVRMRFDAEEMAFRSQAQEQLSTASPFEAVAILENLGRLIKVLQAEEEAAILRPAGAAVVDGAQQLPPGNGGEDGETGQAVSAEVDVVVSPHVVESWDEILNLDNLANLPISLQDRVDITPHSFGSGSDILDLTRLDEADFWGPPFGLSASNIIGIPDSEAFLRLWDDLETNINATGLSDLVRTIFNPTIVTSEDSASTILHTLKAGDLVGLPTAGIMQSWYENNVLETWLLNGFSDSISGVFTGDEFAGAYSLLPQHFVGMPNAEIMESWYAQKILSSWLLSGFLDTVSSHFNSLSATASSGKDAGIYTPGPDRLVSFEHLNMNAHYTANLTEAIILGNIMTTIAGHIATLTPQGPAANRLVNFDEAVEGMPAHLAAGLAGGWLTDGIMTAVAAQFLALSATASSGKDAGIYTPGPAHLVNYATAESGMAVYNEKSIGSWVYNGLWTGINAAISNFLGYTIQPLTMLKIAPASRFSSFYRDMVGSGITTGLTTQAARIFNAITSRNKYIVRPDTFLRMSNSAANELFWQSEIDSGLVTGLSDQVSTILSGVAKFLFGPEHVIGFPEADNTWGPWIASQVGNQLPSGAMDDIFNIRGRMPIIALRPQDFIFFSATESLTENSSPTMSATWLSYFQGNVTEAMNFGGGVDVFNIGGGIPKVALGPEHFMAFSATEKFTFFSNLSTAATWQSYIQENVTDAMDFSVAATDQFGIGRGIPKVALGPEHFLTFTDAAEGEKWQAFIQDEVATAFGSQFISIYDDTTDPDPFGLRDAIPLTTLEVGDLFTLKGDFKEQMGTWLETELQNRNVLFGS